MASAEVESCHDDSNFAVICSFVLKFGGLLGINMTIAQLQEMLEDTKNVPEPLVDLLIRLLRRCRKWFHKERWEKAMVKFCHEYSSVDAWELERFGFKKAKLSVKLELVKRLMELQFDGNPKFKVEVNKQEAGDLRLLPIGRDLKGHTYWLQRDEEMNLRIYQEEAEEETSWKLLCRSRSEFGTLLHSLLQTEGIPPRESTSSSNCSENGDSNLPSAAAVGVHPAPTIFPSIKEEEEEECSTEDKKPLPIDTGQSEEPEMSPALTSVPADAIKTEPTPSIQKIKVEPDEVAKPTSPLPEVKQQQQPEIKISPSKDTPRSTEPLEVSDDLTRPSIVDSNRSKGADDSQDLRSEANKLKEANEVILDTRDERINVELENECSNSVKNICTTSVPESLSPSLNNNECTVDNSKNESINLCTRKIDSKNFSEKPSLTTSTQKKEIENCPPKLSPSTSTAESSDSNVEKCENKITSTSVEIIDKKFEDCEIEENKLEVEHEKKDKSLSEDESHEVCDDAPKLTPETEITRTLETAEAVEAVAPKLSEETNLENSSGKCQVLTDSTDNNLAKSDYVTESIEKDKVDLTKADIVVENKDVDAATSKVVENDGVKVTTDEGVVGIDLKKTETVLEDVDVTKTNVIAEDLTVEKDKSTAKGQDVEVTSEVIEKKSIEDMIEPEVEDQDVDSMETKSVEEETNSRTTETIVNDQDSSVTITKLREEEKEVDKIKPAEANHDVVKESEKLDENGLSIMEKPLESKVNIPVEELQDSTINSEETDTSMTKHDSENKVLEKEIEKPVKLKIRKSSIQVSKEKEGKIINKLIASESKDASDEQSITISLGNSSKKVPKLKIARKALETKSKKVKLCIIKDTDNPESQSVQKLNGCDSKDQLDESDDLPTLSEDKSGDTCSSQKDNLSNSQVSLPEKDSTVKNDNETEPTQEKSTSDVEHNTTVSEPSESKTINAERQTRKRSNRLAKAPSESTPKGKKSVSGKKDCAVDVPQVKDCEQSKSAEISCNVKPGDSESAECSENIAKTAANDISPEPVAKAKNITKETFQMDFDDDFVPVAPIIPRISKGTKSKSPARKNAAKKRKADPVLEEKSESPVEVSRRPTRAARRSAAEPVTNAQPKRPNQSPKTPPRKRPSEDSQTPKGKNKKNDTVKADSIPRKRPSQDLEKAVEETNVGVTPPKSRRKRAPRRGKRGSRGRGRGSSAKAQPVPEESTEESQDGTPIKENCEGVAPALSAARGGHTARGRGSRGRGGRMS